MPAWFCNEPEWRFATGSVLQGARRRCEWHGAGGSLHTSAPPTCMNRDENLDASYSAAGSDILTSWCKGGGCCPVPRADTPLLSRHPTAPALCCGQTHPHSDTVPGKPQSPRARLPGGGGDGAAGRILLGWLGVRCRQEKDGAECCPP